MCVSMMLWLAHTNTAYNILGSDVGDNLRTPCGHIGAAFVYKGVAARSRTMLIDCSSRYECPPSNEVGSTTVQCQAHDAPRCSNEVVLIQEVLSKT